MPQVKIAATSETPTRRATRATRLAVPIAGRFFSCGQLQSVRTHYDRQHIVQMCLRSESQFELTARICTHCAVATWIGVQLSDSVGNSRGVRSIDQMASHA